MFRVNIECYVAVIRVIKAYVDFPFLYEITTKTVCDCKVDNRFVSPRVNESGCAAFVGPAET